MENKRFSKNAILTIPNLISLFRILLIPLIIWLYCGKKQYAATIAVVAISGVSDIIDGKIARRFNIVSDVGKKIRDYPVYYCLTDPDYIKALH